MWFTPGFGTFSRFHAEVVLSFSISNCETRCNYAVKYKWPKNDLFDSHTKHTPSYSRKRKTQFNRISFRLRRRESQREYGLESRYNPWLKYWKSVKHMCTVNVRESRCEEWKNGYFNRPGKSRGLHCETRSNCDVKHTWNFSIICEKLW